MLLIVWHSRTGGARAMAEAALAGACAASADRARMVAAQDADAAALAAAGGYLFVCPENLGGLSGQMKEMFDRSYHALLGRIEGRPYATAIAAGSAGQGAGAQIDRIVTGWRLRRVAEPLVVNFAAQTTDAILAEKHLLRDDALACRHLGEAMAEGMASGIF